MANEYSYNNTIMSKAEFEKSSVKSLYSSYEEYFSKALKYSTFDLAKSNKFNVKFNYKEFINMRITAHEKHNAESERLIAKYKELEQIYLEMKDQQATINNSLQRKYNVSSNNQLLTEMSNKNSLFDQGLYSKSAKSVNEAYSNFISALQTANYQTHEIV